MPPKKTLEVKLPLQQWHGEAVRVLTGASRYAALSEFAPPAAKYAAAVAYIRRGDGKWKGYGGTGFLVAPDLLLTNNHVLPTPEAAAQCEVWFNFQLDAQGKQLPVERYTCVPDGFLLTSAFNPQGVTAASLDYTLIRINTPTAAGTTRFYLPIAEPAPQLSRQGPWTIIQHPGQRPTMVAQGEYQLAFPQQYPGPNDRILQYWTDTEEGASGSPVLNEYWQVIALHHGGYAEPPGPDRKNEGIWILSILRDVAARAPQLALPKK